MSYKLVGVSPVTEYQLERYSILNGVTDETILLYYIDHASEYNVQIDVAYGMALSYTHYFTSRIPAINNFLGIGTQENGTKLETFSSVEECVIAHLEILQKCGSDTAGSNNTHSDLVRRIKPGSYKTTDALYAMWGFPKDVSVYDFDRMIREIQRTRKEDVEWAEDPNNYYYIQVKSSPSRSDIIMTRSDLKDKGFDTGKIYITAKNGLYYLEVGRYVSPLNTSYLQKQLQIYGYNGEIKHHVSN